MFVLVQRGLYNQQVGFSVQIVMAFFRGDYEFEQRFSELFPESRARKYNMKTKGAAPMFV